MTVKECFVICPIGEEGSEIRRWSDLTFDYIITPVVKELGYTPLRADSINESGVITHQIIEKLIEAPLVIADLTNQNPNVFYELAIRHSVEKPYVQMINKDEIIPFDIKQLRTIFFNTEIDQAEKARHELKKQIEFIHDGKFKPTNPITLAENYTVLHNLINTKFSAESTDASKIILESISELVESVNDIKMEISNLKVESQKQHKLDTFLKNSDVTIRGKNIDTSDEELVKKLNNLFSEHKRKQLKLPH